MSKILLFEPLTNSHKELQPSFIKYFIDLGYDVDILIIENTVKYFDVFSRMNIDYKYGIIEKSIEDINSPSFMIFLNNYKHIFCMSSVTKYKHDIGDYSFFMDYPIFLYHNSIYIVEHDLDGVNIRNENLFLTNNHLLTLWNFKKGGIPIYVNYFGDINIKDKNDKTTFIVIGSNQSHRRNYDLLVNTVNNLVQNNSNFEIIMIGSGNTKLFNKLDNNIKKYFTIYDRLNFNKMYDILEQVDFFLPLYDNENELHLRYINSKISGNINLIYGFAKPPIIQETFADFYKFNSNNAVVYDKNDNLLNAMQEAINMSPIEYREKQNNLYEIAKRLQNEAKNNLEKILKIDIPFEDRQKIIQDNNIEDIYHQKGIIYYDKLEYYFLGLPILKIKEKQNKKKYYLFGLPIWKINTKNNKKKYYLFSFLPILTINRK